MVNKYYRKCISKQCIHGPTNHFKLTSPIGSLDLETCPKGVHRLCQTDDVTDENFNPDKNEPVRLIWQLYPDNGYQYKPVHEVIYWLVRYFGGQTTPDMPNICFIYAEHGSFKDRVWQTLIERVPYGTTVSYQKLASWCGNSNACRAVGQSMRQNPVFILVPCHRVIHTSKKHEQPVTKLCDVTPPDLKEECSKRILTSKDIGNYSAGRRNKTKAWLLSMEGLIIQD